MNRMLIAVCSSVAAAATLAATPARADEAPRSKLGEHPAIIAARLHASAGYDYASKFYPHPAGYALLAAAPREMGEHPAVLVARAAARRAADGVTPPLAWHPALTREATMRRAAPDGVLAASEARAARR